MERYSPEEYLVAICDAVADNGFRRIEAGREGRPAALSMTSFFVFLDGGRTGGDSEDGDWSGRSGKGW